MRLMITAMVGLLLGGVIGRLGPASDLASLEAELAEARASADCETQSLGRDLAALMGSGLDTPQRRAPPEPPVDLDAGEAEAEAMREEVTGGLRRELGDDTELQAARTALALRKSQARAVLV